MSNSDGHGARFKAVQALHPMGAAFSVTVPSTTTAALKRAGARMNWVTAVMGFFATIVTDGSEVLVYRGGSSPRVVARIGSIGEINEDEFDNGEGTYLPAVVITSTSSPDEAFGFFPHAAGALFPEKDAVGDVAAVLRQHLNMA